MAADTSTKVPMVADAKFKLDAGAEEWLKSGDEFETDLDNGRDLAAMGFAHFKHGMFDGLQDAGAPRRGYRRRDMTPKAER